MKEKDIIFIVIVAVAIIAFIILSVFIAIYKKKERFVKATSNTYKLLKELNTKQKFHIVSAIANFRTTCGTKREIDKYMFSFGSILYLNKNQCAKVYENFINWKKYQEEFSKIKISTAEDTKDTKFDKGLDLVRYNKIEKRLLKSGMLSKPVTSICIHCVASYTSPAGRNHYTKTHTYQNHEIMKAMEIEYENNRRIEESNKKSTVQSLVRKEVAEKVTTHQVNYNNNNGQDDRNKPIPTLKKAQNGEVKVNNRIIEKRTIASNLVKNTDILEAQFASYGLKISSVGYDIGDGDSKWLDAYIEIISTAAGKLDDEYVVVMTLYDENGSILKSYDRALYSNFNGLETLKFYFQSDGIALAAHKSRVSIKKKN